jgi:sarcosine oxidase, subunit beta
MKRYDVIVIGAGSVGLPVAFNLQRSGLRVLVLDELSSPGQGQNKAAIGGIRATHSQFAKIKTCRRSLGIFKSWQETYGDDIGWQEGGYCFVAYTPELAAELQAQVALQTRMDLDIDWLEAGQIRQLIPDINPEGLRGGTFSPRDGSASPLKAMAAYYRYARSLGGILPLSSRCWNSCTLKIALRG